MNVNNIGLLNIMSLKQLFVYFAALTFIIAVERLYRDTLFNLSIPLIRDIQRERTATGTLIFTTLSKFGEGELYLIIFLLIYVYGGKAKAMYIMTYICSCAFVMNVSKMLHFEPRPYFVDDDIQCLDKCSAEYGNPSGHSLFAGFFIFLCLDQWCGTNEEETSLPNKLTLRQKVFFALAVVIKLLVGFSRLYVGAHSMN